MQLHTNRNSWKIKLNVLLYCISRTTGLFKLDGVFTDIQKKIVKRVPFCVCETIYCSSTKIPSITLYWLL